MNMTHSESWNWTNSYKEIASLCVPKWSSVPDISDVSYCTNIWKNCTAFKINENVLHELQTVRNELIAHNAVGKLTDDETTRVFDAIKRVFKDKDVSPHINAHGLIKHLLLIKYQTSLTHLINTCSQTLEEAKAKLKDFTHNQKKQLRSLKCPERYVYRCFQFLIMALVMWWLFPTFPYSDNSLDEEWLFAEIQDSLEQTKSRGMLLLAQMGYGKSALISHLLCAKQNEKGRLIRDKVVAFH
ncbi:hypothetical protein MAR_002274, partial [Mya arenaria]